LNLSEKVKRLRKERELTQKELADKLGVNSSHLSRLEKGKYQPSTEMLKKFAEFFGVTTDYLLSDEEIPEINIKNKSLAERVKLIDSLDEEDQNALIHIIDSMLTKKKMKEVLETPAISVR